jgi:putative ABC transport system substrate-binding protein
MQRRKFVTLVGGSMVALSLTARAQQAKPVRRIGVLLNRAADDPEGQAGVAVFRQTLQQLGWADGTNVRYDVRWGQDQVEYEGKYAAELVGLAPDIILAGGTLSVRALQNVTRVLPIVFVGVTDPAGSGFVESLARPGGNSTGFMLFEFGFTGKWLEILKQIDPGLKRAAVLRDAANPAALAQYGAIQAIAQPLGVEVNSVNIGNAGEIERAVKVLAGYANSGLIVTPSAGVSIHHDLIITLAARHRLPAVYGNRSNVNGGGLIFYGPDRTDQFRRAASYVDRILKGEKPADLPVEVPTKYELAINLKTAKALGLNMPPTLLTLADEVIE